MSVEKILTKSHKRRFLVFRGPCFSMAVARKRLLKHILAVSTPFPFDAVKTPYTLPVTVEIRNILKSRNARLKSFSTVKPICSLCHVCQSSRFFQEDH